MTLFAAILGTGSLIELLITLVIVVGAIAIVIILIRAMGVSIPQWVLQIGGILILIVVAVVVLRFLSTL